MFLMSYRSGLIIGVGRMHYRTKAIGFVLALFACGGCAGVPQSYAHTGDPCRGSGTSIVVEGKHNLLHLCRNHRHQRVAAAFGQAGLGKEKVGDKKTPVGIYALGTPRRSYSGFKTFIEVKVPRKMGIAVGIHGPEWSRFLGGLNTGTVGRWAVSLWLETKISMPSPTSCGHIQGHAFTFIRTHKNGELPLAGQGVG